VSTRRTEPADPGTARSADARDALIEALGVDLPAPLLEQALIHRSYSYEHGSIPTNERLEFLGDAVLGFVVTDALFRAHPDDAEGQLSRMRISVVSRTGLAQVARALGVGEAVRLGRGETAQGGHDKDSILADTTEALIGAVYVAHGIEVAYEVVARIAGPLLSAARQAAVDSDQKTTLQMLAAERGHPPPEYDVDTGGPIHDRVFLARVRVGAEVLGEGTGRSKKVAEQAAAARGVAVLSGDGPATGDMTIDA